MLLEIFLFILINLSIFCLYRIIRGPSIADRMVAIDILGIIVVGITVILSIKTGKGFFIDIGFAWMILSFIGTLALAKYLTGAKLDE